MITTIYNILNPVTDLRSDIQWVDGEVVDTPDSGAAKKGFELDGGDYWLLPSIYDADAHMSMEPLGLYASDFHRALAGGVTHMNVSVPWHMTRQYGTEALVTELCRSNFPSITPIMLVFPDENSEDFPLWLGENRQVFQTLMPPVCKLYTMDPNFDRNLEALLKAELLPLIWCETDDALEELLNRVKEPVYIRHTISGNMASTVRSNHGNIIQTSPHMLLKLANKKRDGLTVMPTPPDEEERASLINSLINDVDIIASDHVAPQFGDPIGPGLQSQQHFLPALLTLSEQYDLPLEKIFEKVTTSPSRVYGVNPEKGLLVVDPDHQEKVSVWPNQESDRAPFEGQSLKGRVLAVIVNKKVTLI